jgi:hypothetical protein
MQEKKPSKNGASGGISAKGNLKSAGTEIETSRFI